MARLIALMVASAAATLIAASTARAPTPTLHFRVLARTGIKLTDVVWTGKGLLYVENTKNTIWAAPPAGRPLTAFASMPELVEETRCRVSPGTHGWTPGFIFCHAPDNTIYRISPDGRSVTPYAKLPEEAVSDGALAFDTGGAFGYALVAATGRSGATQPGGGAVYTIDTSGSVRRIGHYAGPGGADELEVAPAGFGAARRAALLTVDAGKTGRVVAVDAAGRARDVARLPDGPNPIAAVIPSAIRGGAYAGLYLTDTLSGNAYFAPVSELRAYAGAVIVGSEIEGLIWVIRPQGRGFSVTRLPSTLRGKTYNLEAMTYVSP